MANGLKGRGLSGFGMMDKTNVVAPWVVRDFVAYGPRSELRMGGVSGSSGVDRSVRATRFGFRVHLGG